MSVRQMDGNLSSKPVIKFEDLIPGVHARTLSFGHSETSVSLDESALNPAVGNKVVSASCRRRVTKRYKRSLMSIRSMEGKSSDERRVCTILPRPIENTSELRNLLIDQNSKSDHKDDCARTARADPTAQVYPLDDDARKHCANPTQINPLNDRARTTSADPAPSTSAVPTSLKPACNHIKTSRAGGNIDMLSTIEAYPTPANNRNSAFTIYSLLAPQNGDHFAQCKELVAGNGNSQYSCNVPNLATKKGDIFGDVASSRGHLDCGGNRVNSPLYGSPQVTDKENIANERDHATADKTPLAPSDHLFQYRNFVSPEKQVLRESHELLEPYSPRGDEQAVVSVQDPRLVKRKSSWSGDNMSTLSVASSSPDVLSDLDTVIPSTPDRRDFKDDYDNSSSSSSDISHSPSVSVSHRSQFTPHQISRLERLFTKHQYLGSKERQELAQELNMTDNQVKTWFQNRRMKVKRKRNEETAYYSQLAYTNTFANGIQYAHAQGYYGYQSPTLYPTAGYPPTRFHPYLHPRFTIPPRPVFGANPGFECSRPSYPEYSRLPVSLPYRERHGAEMFDFLPEPLPSYSGLP